MRHADDPTLARLGSLSDAVFAFAMTLQILAIRIPHPTDADAAQGLLALLAEQRRSFLAIVLSFMLVGIKALWTRRHHARADHRSQAGGKVPRTVSASPPRRHH